MPSPLRVGLDLREVSPSNRNGRRMTELVYELDRLGSNTHFELFSGPTSLVTRHEWSDRTRIVSPTRVLRALRRPLLGHLRTALWGEAQVMHFLTGDCWETPTCKTVVTLHDLAPLHLPEQFFDGGADEKRYFDRLDRIFRVADRVGAVSDFSKEEILARFPAARGKLQRIYPGVNAEFFPQNWGVQDRLWFREKIGAPEGFLLYCGGVDKNENIPFLLEAFKAFRERSGSERKLIVVGDIDFPGGGTSPVYDTASRLGLGRSIRFPGSISDPFLRRHYCSASLFVFPSKMEGFPYAPMEAMACGCPVLSANTGALPEILGDAAHLLPPDDPTTWAEAMETLLEDNERRRELVARGKDRVARFRWERAALEYLEVYKSVV
jgi:glycosyltransferase involved in cell wall biosynthesis